MTYVNEVDDWSDLPILRQFLQRQAMLITMDLESALGLNR